MGEHRAGDEEKQRSRWLQAPFATTAILSFFFPFESMLFFFSLPTFLLHPSRVFLNYDGHQT